MPNGPDSFEVTRELKGQGLEPKVSVLSQAIGENLKKAEALRTSENTYERYTFAEAEARVDELWGYHTEGIIDERGLRTLLSAEIAKPGIEGYLDPKTGQLNENGFDYVLAGMIKQSARLDKVVAVGYLDLIGFKDFNDKFSHETGDDVLRAVGEFLRAKTRGEEHIARFGGDEFGMAYMLDKDAGLAGIQGRFTPDVLNKELTTHVGKRIQELRGARGQDPLNLTDVTIGARFGLALHEKGNDVRAIKEKADMAMNAQRDPNSRR